MADQQGARPTATIVSVLAAGVGIVAILNFATASRWEMSPQEQHTDRYGGKELRDFSAATPDECGQTCISDTACQAYSFNVEAHQCWLKADVPGRRENAGFVSAVKRAKPWWKLW